MEQPPWVSSVEAGDLKQVPADFCWNNSSELAHLIDGYDVLGEPSNAIPASYRILEEVVAQGSTPATTLEVWAAIFIQHRGWRMDGYGPSAAQEANLDKVCQLLRTRLLGLNVRERDDVMTAITSRRRAQEAAKRMAMEQNQSVISNDNRPPSTLLDESTDPEWTAAQWAAVTALAHEVPAGVDRECWLDACNRREQEFAQVLMVEYGLSFPPEVCRPPAQSNSSSQPQREDYRTEEDFLDALHDTAPVSPIKINADKFGYTEGDITITDEDWTDAEWAALKAMAPQVEAGSSRECWVDACDTRNKEFAQVLICEFGLSFPIIKD